LNMEIARRNGNGHAADALPGSVVMRVTKMNELSVGI
jgi:hypothetical protein